MSRLDSLLPLLPRDLRISIIDRRGNVLFDNGSDGKPIVENHLSRPEIAQALIRGGGSHIRHSATTGKTYYYYARLFGNDFVRVALPYDNAAKLSLKADDFFLYFMLLLFFVALISLLYLSDRFGKAVSGLRDFLVSTENNHPDFDKVRFPDTELGEIGNRIVTNYRLLRESRNLLDTEREKLIRHFHYSDEGICIFSPDGDKIYANSHFIQHLNTILDEPTSDATAILRAKDFGDLREFLQRHRPVNPQSASIPIYETKLTREGRHFAVRLLIFNDNSFEITLDNITAQEKNRLLKQEMTNNIAHELKTPVTSIRGYLETLLQQHEISPDKQRFFLDRAYTQALRLSDLIRDVALITKIEEATDLFERKPVDLKQVVEEVIADHKNTLDAHRVQIVDRISRGTTVEGRPHAALLDLLEPDRQCGQLRRRRRHDHDRAIRRGRRFLLLLVPRQRLRRTGGRSGKNIRPFLPGRRRSESQKRRIGTRTVDRPQLGIVPQRTHFGQKPERRGTRIPVLAGQKELTETRFRQTLPLRRNCSQRERFHKIYSGRIRRLPDRGRKNYRRAPNSSQSTRTSPLPGFVFRKI